MKNHIKIQMNLLAINGYIIIYLLFFCQLVNYFLFFIYLINKII